MPFRSRILDPSRPHSNYVRLGLLLLLAPLLIAGFRMASFEVYRVIAIVFSPDGSRLAAISQESDEKFALELRDARTGRRLVRQTTRDRGLAIPEFSRDGEWLVVRRPQFVILDGWSLRPGPSLAHGHSAVVATHFTRDGESLWTVGHEGTVRSWNLATWQVEWEETSDAQIEFVRFSDDDRLAAVWNNAGGTRLLKIKDGELRFDPARELKLQQRFPSCFSSDSSRFVASPGSKQPAAVYDSTTAAELFRLTGTQRSPAAFSPDGKLLVAGDAAGTIHVWDVEAGTELRQRRLAEQGYHDHVAFSPDSRLIALATADGACMMLDAATLRTTWSSSDARTGGSLVALLVAAFVPWCMAWAWTRANGRSRSNPAWDVAIIAGIVFSGLVLRVSVSGDVTNIDRPALQVLLGLLAAGVWLVVFWAKSSSGRWLIRFSGLMAGLSAACVYPLVFWPGSSWITWQLLVGSVSLIGGMFAVLVLLGWAGLRVHRVNESGDDMHGRPDPSPAPSSPGVSPRPSQVSLSEMMMAVGSLAVFFAVLRFAKPADLPANFIACILLRGLCLAVTAAAATWFALGTRWLAVRMLAVALAVPPYALVLRLVFSSIAMPDRSWREYILPTSLVVFVAAALWVYRLHGFRFDRLRGSLTPANGN